MDFCYSAAIRTLGTAGDKYRMLLESLLCQTIKPYEIISYIAEGYPIPSDYRDIVRYVFVPKGMVSQRALTYEDVKTDYILFLDDDMKLDVNSVEVMYDELISNNGDIIAAEVFHNERRPIMTKLAWAFTGRMLPGFQTEWATRIMRNSGFVYINKPIRSVYKSQSNSGNCFLCKKKVFLEARFEEELWLDKLPYSIGDDQTMFYKLFLQGKTVLTSFDSGVIHLDAGSSKQSIEKQQVLAYCELYFRLYFWRKFIYGKEMSRLYKMIDVIQISVSICLLLFLALIKVDMKLLRFRVNAVRNVFKEQI